MVGDLSAGAGGKTADEHVHLMGVDGLSDAAEHLAQLGLADGAGAVTVEGLEGVLASIALVLGLGHLGVEDGLEAVQFDSSGDAAVGLDDLCQLGLGGVLAEGTDTSAQILEVLQLSALGEGVEAGVDLVGIRFGAVTTACTSPRLF